MAHLAPTGNPHTSPMTTAEHPVRESPNSLPKGRSRGKASHSPMPLATIISESTIKGNSDGTMARAERVSPSRIQFAAISARRSIKASVKRSKTERQIVPIRGRVASFLCACCNVILPLLVA